MEATQARDEPVYPRFDAPGPLAGRRTRPTLPADDEPDDVLLTPILPVSRRGMGALRQERRARGLGLSQHFQHEVLRVRMLADRLRAADPGERVSVLARIARDSYGIDGRFSDEEVYVQLRACFRKAREEVRRFRDAHIPEASSFLLSSVGKLEAEADPAAVLVELGRMPVMRNGGGQGDLLPRIVAFTLRRDLVLALRIFEIEMRIRQLGEHVLSWIVAARSKREVAAGLLPTMREEELRRLAVEDPLALITHLLTLRLEEMFFVRDKVVGCVLHVAVSEEDSRPLRLLAPGERPADGERLREVPFGYRLFRTSDGTVLPVAFDPGQKQLGSILWKLLLKDRLDPTELPDLVRFRLTFRDATERAAGIRAATAIFPLLGGRRRRTANAYSAQDYDVVGVNHKLYGWDIEGHYDTLRNYLRSVLERSPINHRSYKKRHVPPLAELLFPKAIFGIEWSEEQRSR